MKLTIEVQPGTIKRVLFAVATLAALGTAVAAYAVPVTFEDGDLLTAEHLNSAFADIERRLEALESKPANFQVTSWATEVVTLNDSAGGEIEGHVTTAKSRRVGDSLEVLVATGFPAAPPAIAGYYVWKLPNRPDIDRDKLTGRYDVLGSSELIAAPANEIHACIPNVGGGGIALDCDGMNGSVMPGAPASLGEGSYIMMRFTLPIAGWTESSP